MHEGTNGNVSQYSILAAQSLESGFLSQYNSVTSPISKLYGRAFVKSTTFLTIFFGISVIEGRIPSFGKIPPPSKPYFNSSNVSKK